MKIARLILIIVLLVIAITVCYLFFNMYTAKTKQISVEQVGRIELDKELVNRFSEAIQIPTISPENPVDFDSIQFDRFNTFLKTNYPLSDSLLDHKVFNTYSHLFLWKGSDQGLKPVIFLAHSDVVPVIEENRVYWKEDPFGGLIKNDTIWGRGCVDDKIGVIGLLESVEHLLNEGFKPKRDIYISIGHDEEINGLKGAQVMSSFLKEQGIQAEFIMDEGGTITSGMVPGIEQDVALIGIAEKGSVSLKLSTELEGGHSSMPANETSIDVLSKAIYQLKSNPFPATISPPVEGFLKYLGPEMPFVNRLAFANKSLFEPVIIDIYESTHTTNALVRTTTAPTIFDSGVKENVIPLFAEATVNFRIIAGSSVDEVVSYVKNTIDDDRVEIEIGNFNTEPSKISDTDSQGFTTIHKTIKEVFPETLVSPYLVLAATDARHYGDISDQIFRFSPMRINKSNVNSIHGLNERIAVGELENGIRFYIQLIKNAGLDQ